MSGFMNKVMNFVGFDTDGDMEGSMQDQFDSSSFNDDMSSYNTKRPKIVNFNNNSAKLNVVITMPESFEEACDIVDHLKGKKPCVINLEGVEREVCRRIVDFLSGSVYAVDGNIQKISTGIFLITPHNVNVMGDFKDELRNKGIFPWNNL